MAFFDTTWYVHAGDGSTTGYYAVPKWTASTTVNPGQLVRQTAPAAGSERVFVCVNSSSPTTGSTEPTWVITRGAQTTDATVAWDECTGQAGVNGDLTNCLSWPTLATKAISVGEVVSNSAHTYLFICNTAGTTASTEPTWNTTTGATTTSGTCIFVCIGPIANFPPWSAPHARLGNALTATWGVAGNDFYIADNSAETSTGAIAINLGTVTSPCRFFSVDHTASTPPNAAALKRGAKFTSTSAATNAIIISTSAQTENYVWGCDFVANGAITGNGFLFGIANSYHARLENCTFVLGPATVAGTVITIGPGSQTGGQADFINCSFGFNNASQFINWNGGQHTWRDTPDPCFTGTIPNALIHCAINCPGVALFEGVDFSSATGTLFSNVSAGTFFTLKNCKMNVGSVITSFTAVQSFMQIDLVNCDSGAAIYRNERYNLYGTLNTSVAQYRSGGALDGGVPISQRFTTTAFCHPQRPFLGFPLAIWNDKVGASVTVTLYVVINGVSVIPTNNQIWFDMEYMADAGSPITSFASCGLATLLTTPTQYTADAVSAWTGVVSTAPFQMSVTVTPQQKGYFTLYPKVGAAMSNVFIDPQPVLS